MRRGRKRKRVDSSLLLSVDIDVPIGCPPFFRIEHRIDRIRSPPSASQLYPITTGVRLHPNPTEVEQNKKTATVAPLVVTVVYQRSIQSSQIAPLHIEPYWTQSIRIGL